MGKHKFGNRYNDEDFLAAIPENQMITTMGIMRRVGCSRTTLDTYMEKLVELGKVKLIDIIDGRDVVWQKVV